MLNMLRLLDMQAGNSGKNKDVALDIKADEQTCEACTHTQDQTHTV